jgi:hypothetical protein
MWTTVVVLTGLMIATGVISVVAVWMWVKGDEWVNVTVEGWTVAMTVLHIVMWVLVGGVMVMAMKDAREEMVALREKDPSIDVTLLRWSGGCCQREQRRADGYGQPLLV